MKKFLGISLALTMLLGTVTGCSSSSSTTTTTTESTSTEAATTETEATTDYSDVKIAVLLSGSANDGGWSQMAADAGADAAANFPGATVNVAEQLPTTDFESTMRGYADAGYTLIVAHGAEFLDVTEMIAAEYPDIDFINTSARAATAPNLTSIDFATAQLGVLTGIILAMASENGKIGLIGSTEVDSLVLWSEYAEKGAQYVNPDAEVYTIFTGSYDDALMAKQAVDALVEKGCDIISQNADACGIGAVQQSAELGLMNVGNISDQYAYGDTCFISILQDAQLGITYAIEQSLLGELEQGVALEMGAEAGVITLTDYAGVFADVLTDDEKAYIQDLWEQSRDGLDLTTLVD